MMATDPMGMEANAEYPGWSVRINDPRLNPLQITDDAYPARSILPAERYRSVISTREQASSLHGQMFEKSVRGRAKCAT